MKRILFLALLALGVLASFSYAADSSVDLNLEGNLDYAALQQLADSLREQNSHLLGKLISAEEKVTELSAAEAGTKTQPLSRLALKKEKTIKSQEDSIVGLRSRLDYTKEVATEEKAALYRRLGLAYTELHEYGRAMESFESALILNPSDAESHYCVGLLCRYFKNDIDQARLHLKRYLQLKPKAKNRKSVEYLLDTFRNDTAPY